MTDKTFTFAAGPEEWTANNEDTSHNTGAMCSGNGYWISSTATWNPITSQYEIECDIKSTHRFSGTWLHVYTGENGGVQYLTFVNRVRSLIYYADDPSGPWTLLTWPNFSADCDGNSFLISDYPQKYWRIVAMTENSTADVCATLSQIVMTDFVDHDALGGGDAYHIARTPNAGGTWQSVEQAWGTAHCASLKPVGNEIVAIKQDTIANTSSLWQGASTLTQKSNLPFGLATPDAMAISSQGLIAVGANEAQEGEMILVSGDGVNWTTPEGAKYHGLASEITSIRWLKPCAINYGRPTGGIQVPTDTGEVIEIPAGNPGEVLLPPSAPGQPPAWGRLNLDDLGDVDTTTTPPQDGDGLVYDSATGQWVPTQVAASVDWADITNKPTTFPPSSHQHDWGDITGEPPIPYVLDDLNNVIAPTPNDGQALCWSDASGAWIPRQPNINYASQVSAGIVEIATNAEVQAGTDVARMVTPAGLASKLNLLDSVKVSEVWASDGSPQAIFTDANGNVKLRVGTQYVNEFSTDGALAGNSHTSIPTEAAVKAYVDNLRGAIEIADSYLSAGAGSHQFSSIPQTYKHLLIVGLARGTRAANTETLAVYFNGSAAANYNYMYVLGTGAGAVSSGGATGDTLGAFGVCDAGNSTAGKYTAYALFIPHYTSGLQKGWAPAPTQTYGTGGVSGQALFMAGSWNLGNAITQINIRGYYTANLAQWSRATLYGLI
jgi:hypothetical protein